MATVSFGRPHTARRRSLASRQAPGIALALALLVLYSGPFVGPLLWLASTALETPDQVYVSPPRWIPAPIRLATFADG